MRKRVVVTPSRLEKMSMKYASTIRQIKEVAEIFRLRREELGLSTRQVAAKAGISHGAVKSIERGTV